MMQLQFFLRFRNSIAKLFDIESFKVEKMQLFFRASIHFTSSLHAQALSTSLTLSSFVFIIVLCGFDITNEDIIVAV